MKHTPFFLILSALAVSLALSACSNAKESLGLTKTPPDEFQVVTHAPLAMPPDYALRPPRPGAARPQEQSTRDTARNTVFGEAAPAQSGLSDTENALLQQAGADHIDPAIRQKVDAESTELGKDTKPVIRKILDIGKDSEPSATVVDAPKEAQRLKSKTKGATPSVTR